jgi:hypothetical protein
VNPNLDRTRRRLLISEASALLARTPGTLDAWLRGLPERWLRAPRMNHRVAARHRRPDSIITPPDKRSHGRAVAVID